MTVLALTPASYAFIADRPKTKFADLRGYRAIALELDRHFAESVAVTKQRSLPFGIEWALALVARVMPIP
jgi:hypothetical protein